MMTKNKWNNINLRKILDSQLICEKLKRNYHFQNENKVCHHVVPKTRSLSSFKSMTWKTNQFNHPNYQFPIEVQCSFTIHLHHTYPTMKTYEKIATP
jgi:hypothetical protein